MTNFMVSTIVIAKTHNKGHNFVIRNRLLKLRVIFENVNPSLFRVSTVIRDPGIIDKCWH